MTKHLKAVDAAKQLPDSAFDAFMRAWNLCDCADLYDGELCAYLDVIADCILAQNKTISALKSKLQNIKTECDDP